MYLIVLCMYLIVRCEMLDVWKTDRSYRTACANCVYIDQERKLKIRRRSDTILVLTERDGTERKGIERACACACA